MNEKCSTDEESELLSELAQQHPGGTTYLDCAACHTAGALVRIAELTNGGELWRCGKCGDEELID